MTDWPWTWADSACCDYLRPEAPHIEVLQSQFSWSPKHVLVLGCGDGRSVNGMAARNPTVQFTGVDMNARYIDRARRNASDNARYVNLGFADMLGYEFEVSDLDTIPDTVILLGVAGYIDNDTLTDALSVASKYSTRDMRLLFNYPNALTWKERTIYRDAIAQVGRDKAAALKIVQAIAAFHPSETVRQYGDALLTREGEQKHMLFAPHFEPMYDWDAEELLARYGFLLIESRTSALALEKATTQDYIRSDGRWQVYGRDQVHDHRD